MKMFERMQELPNVTETSCEQMLEKMAPTYFLKARLPQACNL